MNRPVKVWLACLLVAVSTVLLYVWTGKVENLLLLETDKNYDIANDKLDRLGLTKKRPVIVKDPLTGESKKIHGRFLHVTDFHPDPFYKPGSDISMFCHGGKGDAGEYGDAILGCDSPMALVEKTIDWIEENLKDEIDFIVWTGDNMRHDNDRNYPRFETDIFAMNEKISDLMLEKFGDLPIPSLGNNDVYPHNLFAVGPTMQTREFYKLWRHFVPQSQLHVFNQGVYFFQEVIPNRLAVLSINTLYLFQSNPLVDSCDRKKDPGYKLFLWLGYTLKEMRKRNMKVWLTGHVPPNAKNYDISCLRKYILWSHEYRDVVIGGLYGHMNIDHFIPLDSVLAYKSMESKFRRLGQLDPLQMEQSEPEDLVSQTLEDMYNAFNSSIYNDDAEDSLGFELSFRKNVRIEGGIPTNKVDFMNTVRKSMYSSIKGKKKSGDFGERYSIAHVSPSVVPTFNPSLRVWEYNITDLHETKSLTTTNWDHFFTKLQYILEDDTKADPMDYEEDILELSDNDVHASAKRDKTVPPKMPKSKQLGPAYMPQLFTPERYVQYYLDLESINKKEKKFDYEIEYTTDKDYGMKDLTVREWLKFGRKLGRPVKDLKKNIFETQGKKAAALWAKFLKHSFVSSDYENLGYG
ncbi:hypothetical protein PUMCH_003571 [Australozyma saopauloensis]|uniref:Endopolyphosphatase n=1 Tax=Australozyma saopauloensis TaxID=291208 RepID=A0AAX4HCB0_9ASCO|nr:hypothetical protein PUMCH_003571 [[Candida] saopauloensis]